jgi:hypothetical protein
MLKMGSTIKVPAVSRPRGKHARTNGGMAACKATLRRCEEGPTSCGWVSGERFSSMLRDLDISAGITSGWDVAGYAQFMVHV